MLVTLDALVPSRPESWHRKRPGKQIHCQLFFTVFVRKQSYFMSCWYLKVHYYQCWHVRSFTQRFTQSELHKVFALKSKIGPSLFHWYLKHQKKKQYEIQFNNYQIFMRLKIPNYKCSHPSRTDSVLGEKRKERKFDIEVLSLLCL